MFKFNFKSNISTNLNLHTNPNPTANSDLNPNPTCMFPYRSTPLQRLNPCSAM